MQKFLSKVLSKVIQFWKHDLGIDEEAQDPFCVSDEETLFWQAFSLVVVEWRLGTVVRAFSQEFKITSCHAVAWASLGRPKDKSLRGRETVQTTLSFQEKKTV